MSNSETMNKLVELIKPFARNQEGLSNINDSTNFIQDLNINSSRLVDIILALEDTFDISISDEEAEKLVYRW